MLKLFNKAPGVGILCRFYDGGIVRTAQLAVGNIVSHAVVKQHHPLTDHGNLVAKLSKLVLIQGECRREEYGPDPDQKSVAAWR